ncbi:MAG: DUF58 domain-containing protein [Solirubrobacteraceae bacterium]
MAARTATDHPRGQFTIAGVALTRRGWAFLGLGTLAVVSAYASGRPVLQYVGILLIVLPVLAVGLVRLRRPRFGVSRNFAPDVVAAGHPTSARIAVANRGRTKTVRARWWDELPWGETEERELLPVGRGRTAQLHYELRPPRRGVFGIGPLGVEFGDAFGLARSTLAYGGTHELIVTPEAVPLTESGLTVPAGSGEARLVQRRAAGDDDDAMTREYRTGDAMRRVHWRATARHDELMVRQEEQRSLPRARILIDTLERGYVDDGEAFEWVVRMLASVTVHLRRAGFAVTIDESGHQQLHELGRRRTWGDEEFLAALAALDLVEEPGERRAERPGDGPVIAIVGSPDPHTLDWVAERRRPGSLAVAFMVRNASSIDLLDRSFGARAPSSVDGERLHDAGWLVVPVSADEDHAAAWEAVVVETGRARGPA